ncbi:GAF and ANTAR domain-containing protein [Arthrobacter bussei]|uniref:GAF and ANTAR domain-containing protein n=1 Tax=Arthrobacter bussei TaxID=2594179 RepID=A0A7X1NPE7_9MICC|nr:GAF and ANTAR domain-containing protein [Arthrobacter bussei]MPY10423.1 GAF and ANTAR domain-containing protein [Arthrobacter bussei]
MEELPEAQADARATSAGDDPSSRILHVVADEVEVLPPAEAAARLQDLLVDHPDVRSFLQELADFTAETLGTQGDTYCGITLQRSPSEQLTVASSGEKARAMDEVQYDHNDGPCLHALRVHDEVFIADVASEDRWPDFMRHIARNDVGAMFCLPLDLEGSARAALNLYAEDSSVFSDEYRRVARAFTVQASQALKLAVRVAQHTATAEDLHAVLQTRTEIDLAVGIIMGQDNCSQKDAFDKLRRASNSRNVKLRILAAGMVAGLNGSVPRAHFDPS